MKDNPFKFGTVVDGVHFTDREEEIAFISSHLRSENHLIMISPRRFGKTSLIRKILKESDRKHIYLDLQIVLSEEDFASQLLRRVYRISPLLHATACIHGMGDDQALGLQCRHSGSSS